MHNTVLHPGIVVPIARKVDGKFEFVSGKGKAEIEVQIEV